MRLLLVLGGILVVQLMGCASTEPETIEYVDKGRYTTRGVTATVVKVSRKAGKRVRGICLIAVTEDKPLFDRYCAMMEVHLVDNKGSVIGQTVTDERGVFSFKMDEKARKHYRIKVPSEKYIMASKSVEVMAGAEVLIRLIPKK